MKSKKIFLYIVVCAFTVAMLSSCAIDRKCPAYTKVATETSHTPS